MGWADKILDKVSDPNIAYILLLLGVYGILFELFNPSAILPGVVGVICLILAFYAMHTLPVNYAGLALMVVAVILFLLEIKIVSYGMLAIGGVVALSLGSMMLFRTESALEFVHISWTVIIAAVLVTAFFFLFVVSIGLKAQQSRPVTGIEGMVGDIGESLDPLDPTGTVRVHGEIWQAEAIAGTINKGEKVRVVDVINLKLLVEHIHNSSLKKA
jgi:membrane-bound serine protease (ClpP class)